MTEYALCEGAVPWPIAPGPDGALYIGERDGNAIARMTTAGVITDRYAIPAANADPTDLAFAPDGELWIAEHSIGVLGRMEHGGAFGASRRIKSSPDAMTIGPDGAVWYASADGDGRVGRVDPSR